LRSPTLGITKYLFRILAAIKTFGIIDSTKYLIVISIFNLKLLSKANLMKVKYQNKIVKNISLIFFFLTESCN